MKQSWIWGASLGVIVVLAAALWLSGGDDPIPDETRGAPTTEPSSEQLRGAAGGGAPAHTDRFEEDVVPDAEGAPSRSFIIRGRVLDAVGGGVPDAQVTVHWETHDRALLPVPSLATTSTEADGRYLVRCDKILDEGSVAYRTRRLRIVARKAGYRSGSVSWNAWPAPGVTRCEATLEVRLLETRRVIGRVVSPDGRPVARASVLYRWSSKENSGQGFDALAWTSLDGRFEFSLLGAPAFVSARDRGHGVAFRDVTGTDDGAGDVDVGDLELSPFGSLAGRVVRASGDPVSGVRVVAAMASRVDGVFRQRVQHVTHRGAREAHPREAGGLRVGSCVSTADGSFSMVGLAEGAYAVYAVPRAGNGRLYEGRELDAVHAVGTRGIEVVVDFTQLVASLEDHRGRAVGGVTVTCSQMGVSETGEEVVVDRRMVSTTEDGTADFQVRAGHLYRLQATVPGMQDALCEVEVPEGESVVRRSLVLSPAPAPAVGRVRLRAAGLDRERLRRARVMLVQKGGVRRRLRLHRGNMSTDGWWSVAAGEYDVAVEYDAHNDLESYVTLVATRGQLRVGEGADHEIEVMGQTWGRVRLSWSAPVGSFPPQGVVVPSRTDDPVGFALFQREQGARAWVMRLPDSAVSEPDDGWTSLPVAHIRHPDAMSELHLIPGEVYRSRSLLEPGTYLVRIDHRRLGEARSKVIVKPGADAVPTGTLEVR